MNRFNALSTIIAVEEDESLEDEFPPSDIASSLLVERAQPQSQSLPPVDTSPHLSRTKGASTHAKPTPAPTDELQLSATDHKWVGSGILASADDLALSPETFAAGCNLLQAAARGDLTFMRELLDPASHKTHVNFRDYDRRTALHVAASEGQFSTVQFLVRECGARVNRSDRWGGSPLDDAHRHGHVQVAEYLRSQGAATGSGNRWTNLIQAAADGDLDEVQTLLQFAKTQGPNGQVSNTGSGTSINSNTNAPLATGSFASNARLDVNRGDYDKRTALHLASGEGHISIVKALCDAGADVNAQDRWSRRPLDDAEAGHHAECVAFLQSLGATRGESLQKQTLQNTAATVSTDHLDKSTQRALDNMLIEFTELEMIDRIGSGAFGEIYKCRWRGTLVAAKIIKSAKIRRDWTNRRLANAIQKGDTDRIDLAIQEMDQSSQNKAITRAGFDTSQDDLSQDAKEEALADFRQEISVLKSLRHPHIVLLLAYSTTSSYECIISELMKCSLLDVFQSHLVQGTRMTARTQIIYATQLAQGMNYLHTCKPPILHRDLKPANLLIDHAGALKISDFGLSKVRPNPEKNETEAFTMTGETGSYRFMAPEVFRHEEYNSMVDVYSYGMIFFFLLVGRPPWYNLAGVDAVRRASEEGDRPNIPRHIDQRLQNLLKECWNEHPNVRPPFDRILDVLARYSKDVLKEDMNTVLTTSGHLHVRRQGGCHCTIQ